MMKLSQSYESINDFDEYSNESFEEFEEIEEVMNDLESVASLQNKPVDRTSESKQLDTTIKSNSPSSTIDIIDTFILSQLDFLDQLKILAIQKTINK